MANVGDIMYGMRVVKAYSGMMHEEQPPFNGFEGIIIWKTWDKDEWKVIQTRNEDGKYSTKEIGLLDDDKLLKLPNGEQVVNVIKEKIEEIRAKHPELQDTPIAIDEMMADMIEIYNAE